MKSTTRTQSSALLRLFALLSMLCFQHAHADYTQHAQAREFITGMSTRHGFDPEKIRATLAQARFEPRVLALIQPPATPAARSWQRYRAQFLDRTRIDGGRDFQIRHAAALRRAEQEYGVPAEIIVAIIGIETLYGRNTGSYGTLSALATLAFDYPPRAELFRRELEELFLLAREQGRDPTSYTGSYAGALGYPQFLPSSLRRHAVDFDGNGTIDLEHSAVDAIGSVARYLHDYGWKSAGLIATRARLAPDADPAPLIAVGIEPRLMPARLREAGISMVNGDFPGEPVTLVDLETPDAATEYWFGYHNFYIITRYNKSSFYAMAVFELAQVLGAEASRPRQ
ncbi:MAG: lytic murein transglycosylase B [Azoarcus sp.]|jgi:membrane-bound lytic murein transglycosylase B|nr:lytic murein transglycosylase B [Azoarcus sp.]